MAHFYYNFFMLNNKILKIEFIKKEKGFKYKFLSDSFFDSLRNDYKQFNEWYTKSVDDENKSSYYWVDDGKVIAFLGLKIEYESIKLNDKELPRKRRIKMTTIKSLEQVQSFSQIAIYIATQKAWDLKMGEVYFTINLNSSGNLDKEKLVDIFRDYGFSEIGANESKEIVFLKDLKSNRSSDWKKTYPKFPHKENRKWTYLCIKKTYHDNYLQDTKLSRTIQNRDFSRMAIKKVYIHNQKGIMELSKNDGLLIYRISSMNKTHKSCVTSYGTIIENIEIAIFKNDFNRFCKKVRNYHAFEDEKELREWFEKNKYITFFALNKSLGENSNINHKTLKKNGFWHFEKYPSENKFDDITVKKILQLSKKEN